METDHSHCADRSWQLMNGAVWRSDDKRKNFRLVKGNSSSKWDMVLTEILYFEGM